MATVVALMSPNRVMSPPVVAVAGWLLPGLGYWLIGERGRAIVTGITILLLFVGGIFIAGIRVVDVPGYGDSGQRTYLNTQGGPAWLLTTRPVAAMAQKPWYICQILTGPTCLAASKLSNDAAAAGIDRAKAPLWDVGSIYTSVAGLLNLLVIIDAAYRAGRPAAAPAPQPYGSFA